MKSAASLKNMCGGAVAYQRLALAALLILMLALITALTLHAVEYAENWVIAMHSLYVLSSMVLTLWVFLGGLEDRKRGEEEMLPAKKDL